MEDDLREELSFHLQTEIDKNITAGMSPAEAGMPRCEASEVSSRSRKSVETCVECDSLKQFRKTSGMDYGF